MVGWMDGRTDGQMDGWMFVTGNLVISLALPFVTIISLTNMLNVSTLQPVVLFTQDPPYVVTAPRLAEFCDRSFCHSVIRSVCEQDNSQRR